MALVFCHGDDPFVRLLLTLACQRWRWTAVCATSSSARRPTL